MVIFYSYVSLPEGTKYQECLSLDLFWPMNDFPIGKVGVSDIRFYPDIFWSHETSMMKFNHE